MRLVGRISDWNDEKGYGFVVPHDGGDRAFVHVRAFQFGSRRPVDGDLISYSALKDAQGRTNAADVKLAGQTIERRGSSRQLPRRAIGALSLVAVQVGALFGIVPYALSIGYALLSCLSYLMYWFDKTAAAHDRQRTSESMLHFVDLLGGWPGALIAQQQFRHKTVKASFQSAFWFTVLVNIASVAWLVRSGNIQSLANALLGG